MKHGGMPSILLSLTTHGHLSFWTSSLLLLLLSFRDAEADRNTTAAVGRRHGPNPGRYEAANYGWREKIGERVAHEHEMLMDPNSWKEEHREYDKDKFLEQIPPLVHDTPTDDELQVLRNAQQKDQYAQAIAEKYVNEAGGSKERPTSLEGSKESGRIADLFSKTGKMSLRSHKCPPNCDTYTDSYRIAKNLDERAWNAMQRARNELTQKSNAATDTAEKFNKTLENLMAGLKAYEFDGVWPYAERERYEHQEQMKKFWKAVTTGEPSHQSGSNEWRSNVIKGESKAKAAMSKGNSVLSWLNPFG